MTRLSLHGIVVTTACLAVGCGHSPSSPSSVSATSSQATQSIVTSAVAQAMSQVAVAAPTAGDVPNSFTFPCPGGGSIVSTFSGSLPRDPGTVLTTSSRTEFRDCRNGDTTINGDPYLQSDNEHVFSGPDRSGTTTSSMRTSGGLRFDANGVQGRVQFNCTMTVTYQAPSGTTPAPSSVVWSGTLAWEQPLGSTPVVRSCGPPGS